jgi:carboxyl-terminal processing protease
LNIENKRRKTKGLTTYKDFSAFKEATEKENEERAASAGTTTIDTEDDAILNEAGYILKDFITLINKARETLANTP